MKNNWLSVFLPLMAGCSTVVSPGASESPNISKIESINFESDASFVKQTLGSPAEIKKSKDNPNFEYWIYNNSDGSQRASIEVQSDLKKVTGNLIFPNENEPERKLRYLLEEKFRSSKFELIPLPMCGRDLIPRTVYYIDTQAGIMIEADKNSGEVDSFSSLKQAAAVAMISKIKQCR